MTPELCSPQIPSTAGAISRDWNNRKFGLTDLGDFAKTHSPLLMRKSHFISPNNQLDPLNSFCPDRFGSSFSGDVRVHFKQELELTIGDTIVVQHRKLTLLDTEEGLVLFQLDSEDETDPVAGVDGWELCSSSSNLECIV